MAKLQKEKAPKGGKSNLKGMKKKPSKKKKSIHANTFEERQENRRRKEEFALRKKFKKDLRRQSRNTTKDILSDVSTWVKDNPIHPSTIAHPTQLPVIQRKFHKTYKAFIRNLPTDCTGEEIFNYFYKADVLCSTVRILVHRITNKCLGWGFLEFHDKMDFEKALTLNVSRFRDDIRILVEGSLRSFVPTKKKPQKLITYKPPLKIPPPTLDKDIEIMEI